MAITVNQFADRLRRVGRFLDDADELFTVPRVGLLLGLAKEAARNYLTPLRRANIDAETWYVMVDEFVDGLRAEREGPSLVIRYRQDDVAVVSTDGSVPRPGGDPGQRPITWLDIVAWIQAGEDQQPYGKNLGRGDGDPKNTARKVYRAAVVSTSPEYEPLREAIRQFMRNAGGAPGSPGSESRFPGPDFAGTLVKIWEAVLRGPVRQMLTEHAREGILRLG